MYIISHCGLILLCNSNLNSDYGYSGPLFFTSCANNYTKCYSSYQQTPHTTDVLLSVQSM